MPITHRSRSRDKDSATKLTDGPANSQLAQL